MFRYNIGPKKELEKGNATTSYNYYDEGGSGERQYLTANLLEEET